MYKRKKKTVDHFLKDLITLSFGIRLVNCVLQNMLSEKGQTVTFDHAGSGWSSSTDSPRTIENMTNELTVLIDTVAPNKPVVIICHSLGSLEAIRYTQMNPEKVKGIVFLDSGSPEYYSTDSELLAKMINRGTALLPIKLYPKVRKQMNGMNILMILPRYLIIRNLW